MFKKIISVIVALSIALSCLSFSVSASPATDVLRNGSRFYSAVYKDIVSYMNGDISLSDFLSRYAENSKKLIGSNISDLTCITDVLRHLESLGIDIPFEWSEFMGGGGSGGNRDDSVLEGYSSVALLYTTFNPSEGYLITKYLGHDGKIRIDGDDAYTLMLPCDIIHNYKSDGTCWKTEVSTPEWPLSVSGSYTTRWVLYGDWKYFDGSDVDNGLVTPLPVPDIPNYDDPDVPEDDLINFLEDLLQDLMLQFPDTSTIEGLLAAILQKCTSIDDKMSEGGGSSDLTSDEFKTMLDQAILALTVNNVNETDKLLAELVNIRTILQGFEEGEDIPEDEANSILEGLISGLTAGLLSSFGLDVDVNDLVIICKEGGTIGLKLLKGIVDIISFLSAAVPFNVIKTSLTTVFGVIFNENAPTDLVIKIDGLDYTFLSTSFFLDTNVAGALSIIKALISVMIIFIFLKWARKFYLNLM